MRRVTALAAVLAALGGVAAGCAGRDETAPDSTPPVRAALAPAPAAPAPRVLVPLPELVVPAGFRARRVPDAGAQVAVPLGWIALTRLDSLFPGTVQTLGGIDRRVVGPIAALGVPDSPLKLLVLGPVRKGGFAATVTLMVADAGRPQPYGAWLREATGALIARSQVRGAVTTSHVTLPVGKAVRMRFRRLSRGTPAASVVYLSRGGGKVYYLALTSRRHESGLTRAFDTLARSLTILPGLEPTARVTGQAKTA
jgi:hypothetical protein